MVLDCTSEDRTGHKIAIFGRLIEIQITHTQKLDQDRDEVFRRVIIHNRQNVQCTKSRI